MSPGRPALLGNLLKQVSRSFYLTLRVLPRLVRPQIGLAYLLARTSDTIADTTLLPAAERLQALHDLAAHIAGRGQSPLSFDRLVIEQRDSSERALFSRISESLALLAGTPEADRRLIQKVLATIISGQSLDLQRFTEGSQKNVIALASGSDLDDYTYRVAGCVGEFWTEICLAHLFRCSPEQETFLLRTGIRFGKGLQLVNILRDIPADLRQGRCYVPAEHLQTAGLKPGDLLDPANEARFRQIYNPLIALAEEHLRAGWAYTNALPRNSVRVRLACAWPILIGFDTLQLLKTRQVLRPDNRVRIARLRVNAIIARTVLYYPFPRLWSRQVS